MIRLFKNFWPIVMFIHLFTFIYVLLKIFSWQTRWDQEKRYRPSLYFASFPKQTKMLVHFLSLLRYQHFLTGNARLSGLHLEYQPSCYTLSKKPSKSGTTWKIGIRVLLARARLQAPYTLLGIFTYQHKLKLNYYEYNFSSLVMRLQFPSVLC